MPPTPPQARGVTAAWLLLAWSAASPAAESAVLRFCPGNTGPVAYNADTRRYEEGASFDPVFCAEEQCIELLHNIFEPLVSTDEVGRVQPRLATRWQQLDPRRFRFVLRPDVVFHNGEPFDAEAVRFSLLRAAAAYGATAWFPRIERVDIIDPLTVDVVLREPDSLFLYRLGHIGLMLPRRYFREAGERRFGKAPIGTGPFRFDSWDGERREVHLSANPSYWRSGHPQIDRLIYAYRSPEIALEGLINGEFDLIRRLNPRRTRSFMETGAGHVVKAWLPQIVVGGFNTLRPGSPLRDRRVREAINVAVNRDHLIRYGALGNGRVLGGYTLADDPLHSDLPPYPYAPETSRRLLASAGYHDGLSLTMIVDHQVPPQIEDILAVSLRQVGVQLSVTRASESEFLAEVYLPKFGGGEPPSFDILLLSMPVGTIRHAAMVPMTLLYSGEPNESAVRDLRLDQLYEAAIATQDPDEAADLWREIERYTYDNHLLFIGYQEKAVFGARPDLRFTPRTLMTFWDAAFADEGDVPQGPAEAGARRNE